MKQKPLSLIVFCLAAIPLLTAGARADRPPDAGEGKTVISPQWASQAMASAKSPGKDWEEEFHFLEKEINRMGENWFNLDRLTLEAARPSSVYHLEDKTPADIVLRRTRALLEHFRQTGINSDDISRAASDLTAWERRRREQPAGQEIDRIREFKDLCRIRRHLSFANPLLDFDKLVFLTHYTQRQGKGEVHIVDQYLGFNAKPGGSIHILENPFSDNPVARQLMDEPAIASGRQRGRKLEGGSYLSLELSYDAKKLFFAWTQAVSNKVTGKECWDDNFATLADLMKQSQGYHHYFWAPDRVYHIYSLDLESGELNQLTDGNYNTYDPCELPNGRLVYISEKQGGNQRCGGRWITAGVLHSMKRDGSDSYPLSFHETNEWHPSVSNDGMILYTRWDYVDRDDCGAHHLWKCYPDGRDPRSPHGNYAKERELRPFAEFSYRAIPGSGKLAAVAAAHHGISYGSLILVDPSVPDDGAMSQVRRITPEAHFMESERSPGYSHPLCCSNASSRSEFYGTPWPLSEDFFLCVYARNQRDYGIYLVDSFGNRELVWQDGQVPCLDPIPLRPRKKPPVIPDMTACSIDKRPDGSPPSGVSQVFVFNVYDTDRPLPEGVKIKWLRVVNIFTKSTVVQNDPNIGMAHQSLARGSLGLAKVEDDGSVFFNMPANANVYFQLLDENMQAIHSMRSSTYGHSGESLSCVGCHENKWKAPTTAGLASAKALKRGASALIAEPSGSYPLTFPRLVQPVLDRKCISCHAKEPKAPLMDSRTYRIVKDETGSDRTQPNKNGWSNAFISLHKWGWGRHGGNGSHWRQNKFTYTIPGDVGAKASKLIPFLEKGHHGVSLDKEDWHRISLWIDLNTNFYGAYENIEAQARGEVVWPKFGMPDKKWITVK